MPYIDLGVADIQHVPSQLDGLSAPIYVDFPFGGQIQSTLYVGFLISLPPSPLLLTLSPIHPLLLSLLSIIINNVMLNTSNAWVYKHRIRYSTLYIGMAMVFVIQFLLSIFSVI